MHKKTKVPVQVLPDNIFALAGIEQMRRNSPGFHFLSGNSN